MRPRRLFPFVAALGCLVSVPSQASSSDHRQRAGHGHGHGLPCPGPATDAQPAGHVRSGPGRPLRPRAGLNATAAAKAAIDGMNEGFFDAARGQWSPGDPWWLSGVALAGVVDYMRKTGSREYLGQVERVIEAQREPVGWWPQGGGEFRGDSTDDTGWWGLAMVRMYELTGDGGYLDISARDEEYMYACWTEAECGGGLYVDVEEREYKNAIANELYIKLAASLHNRLGNDTTTYLARAEKAWAWFQASGMINEDDLINDGLTQQDDGVCFNNNLTTWTYNQGVILGGLVGLSLLLFLLILLLILTNLTRTELYRATQNKSYLASAQRIASAVLSSPTLTHDGTLTEPCEPADSCNDDQQVFKGIFAANLAELDAAVAADDADADADGGPAPYRSFLEQNALTAYTHRRSGSGSNGSAGGGDLYDVSWAGPFRNATIAKQASAVALMVALI